MIQKGQTGRQSGPSATENRSPAIKEQTEAATGTLSQRMVGYTSNLFATGLILIAGLTIGRQVLIWWDNEGSTTPPVHSVPPSATQFGNLAKMHWIDLGEHDLTLGRMSFTGDVPALWKRLRDIARQSQMVSAESLPPAGPAEERLLQRIKGLSADETTPAGLDLFDVPEPLPMVAVVGQMPGKNGHGTRRVVSWVLALPMGKNQWNLFSYHPHSSSGEGGIAVPIPLPEGSERTLAVRVEDGGALLGFKGPLPSTGQRAMYEGWVAAEGGSVADPWRKLDGSWHARFEHPKLGNLAFQITDMREDYAALVVVEPVPVRATKTNSTREHE